MGPHIKYENLPAPMAKSIEERLEINEHRIRGPLALIGERSNL